MVECNKINVKLSERQLKKLKSSVENKTGTSLRMSWKMLDGNDLLHEIFEKYDKLSENDLNLKKKQRIWC